MDDFQQFHVTYQALEDSLLKLGFILSLHETHRLYSHAESGSLHLLSPHTIMEQRVRPAHLLGARHSVVSMGVTDEETFRKLLLGQAVEAIPRGVRATKPSAPASS